MPDTASGYLLSKSAVVLQHTLPSCMMTDTANGCLLSIHAASYRTTSVAEATSGAGSAADEQQ